MASWKMFLKTGWWLRSSSRGYYDYFSAESEDSRKNTGHVYEGSVMTGLCSRVAYAAES